jgi:hypothetical protein
LPRSGNINPPGENGRRRNKKRKRTSIDAPSSVGSSDDSSSSSSSGSSSGSSTPSEKEKAQTKKPSGKKNKKRRRKKKTSHSSPSGSESSTDTDITTDLETEEELRVRQEDTPQVARRKRKRAKHAKQQLKDKLALFEETWPSELRPPHMRKMSMLRDMTYDTFLRTKDTFDKLEASKNLGEETSARDAKAKKTKYKKGKDDGRKRLHKARWNRQPLVPPEEFYKKVPKKQATVIRHFPMEHLGITGQVPDATITHMHNRAVKVVFDSFCKPTFKAARNGEKAGKYADLFQLLEAVINYSILLHSLWPADYTGLVILKVLTEARWGETAGLSSR